MSAAPKTTLLQSIHIYWKKKTREVISHIITGQGTAFLLMHLVHNGEFFKNNDVLGIALFILIGFTPLVVDFINFNKHHPNISGKLHELESLATELLQTQGDLIVQLIQKEISDDVDFLKKIKDIHLDDFEASNYYEVQKKTNRVKNAIFKTFKKRNQLLVNTILTTLDRELKVIDNVSSNRLDLRVLQHFDYLRDVLGRTLKQVMKPGDHYITLASLDFWTLKPFDPEEFLKVNFEAAFDDYKYIDRVMIIDKKFLNGVGLEERDKNKFNDFVRLIDTIMNSRYELSCNYNSELKIFFHFHNNYKAIRELLDSVIVINKELVEIMFIKVQKLSNIANIVNNFPSENPNIQINFFELEHDLQGNINSNDIIQIIKHVKSKVETKVKVRNQKDEQLIELNKYLAEFKRYFEKINTIYNVDDCSKNENIDLDRTDFFDVRMMHQHYQNLKAINPELFLK